VFHNETQCNFLHNINKFFAFQIGNAFLRLRRAARALYEVHRVSKTAVWKWGRKFSEKVNVKPSRIVRRLIALDEICVKVNRLEYWVYAALDVDGNEI